MESEFDRSAMYKRSHELEPHWQQNADRLFDACTNAIRQFQTDHPDQQCCSFGFDSEPCYGYVLVGLDTPENSLKIAREREDYEVKNRFRQFATDGAWRISNYYATRESVDYANNTGYFAYTELAQVEFPEWEAFANSEQYPDPDEVQDSDYLEGHVRLIFWDVIERLVAADAFGGLYLWSPFRIAYNFHDDGGMTTLRILNWPSV